MEHCPVCDCEVEVAGWCDACIDAELKTQAKEDTPRVRPQIFHT